jgi:hypothetical protein
MADLSITAGAVVPSNAAQKVTGKAGAAISGGQIVYLDSTTTPPTYKLADGNDPTKLPAAGIAGNTAGIGQYIQVIVSDPGLTIGAHSLGIGIPMFLSANPGMICPVADIATGNLTTLVFVTNTTTTVSFGLVGGLGSHA